MQKNPIYDINRLMIQNYLHRRQYQIAHNARVARQEFLQQRKSNARKNIKAY